MEAGEGMDRPGAVWRCADRQGKVFHLSRLGKVWPGMGRHEPDGYGRVWAGVECRGSARQGIKKTHRVSYNGAGRGQARLVWHGGVW